MYMEKNLHWMNLDALRQYVGVEADKKYVALYLPSENEDGKEMYMGKLVGVEDTINKYNVVIVYLRFEDGRIYQDCKYYRYGVEVD